MQQRSHHLFTNSTALMTRGDTNFVDPQLRRLVWMDVMHRRGKSNHLPLIERNHQMMPFVA